MQESTVESSTCLARYTSVAMSEVMTTVPAEQIENDEKYRTVVQTLLRHTSLPFLELVAITPVREDELGHIVEDLLRRNLVTVREKDNVLREIVTIKPGQYDFLAKHYR